MPFLVSNQQYQNTERNSADIYMLEGSGISLSQRSVGEERMKSNIRWFAADSLKDRIRGQLVNWLLGRWPLYTCTCLCDIFRVEIAVLYVLKHKVLRGCRNARRGEVFKSYRNWPLEMEFEHRFPGRLFHMTGCGYFFCQVPFCSIIYSSYCMACSAYGWSVFVAD